MATLAPQITPAGPVTSSYADILAQLQNAFWSIYGTDAQLTPDTQDGQWLGILAQALYDCGQAVLAAYNNQSPSTAQGAGLSSIVKINGLQRQAASNSQAVIIIVGQVGTIIDNGVVGDNENLGTQWALPEEVIIPVEGQIAVAATCTTPGAIAAPAGSLTEILTPTRGWQSAINSIPAVLGNPVETDDELRQRQTYSTSNPAQTTFDSIKGNLANLAGVGRVELYANDDDVADANGLDPHSIAAVVQGGSPADIGLVIANKKAPGIGTNGTEDVVVIDPAGVPQVIKYYPLTNDVIEVVVTIKALTGYAESTGTLIRKSISTFVNGLDIGEDSYTSRLYAPATLNGDAAIAASGMTQQQLDVLAKTFYVVSITQNGNPADIVVPFNYAAVCNYPDNSVLVVT